jgi:sialate O-acetylesterase
MRNWATWALLALVGIWQAAPARADIKPHGLIGDGMVLQQGMKVPIWGTGSPHSTVTVTFQGREFKSEANANKPGHWLVRLDDLKPGGPYEMTIAGYQGEGEGRKKLNTIHLKNVYVGEVWVCSGQSNMEWPLRLAHNAREAIAASKDPQIRLFTVPKNPASSPRHNVQGRWEECNPKTVANFSAVAYFFGRDVQKARKVPVGLIHTSWGGTVAEAWMSMAALEANLDFKDLAGQGRRDWDNYGKAADRYLDALVKYLPAARMARVERKDLPPAPIPPLKNPNTPTALYNGMIAPLLPYAIRGAIWYQGESNAGRAYQYRTLFPAMIKNWRHDWKQGDFPFLLVQLAPWLPIVKEPQESAWAELREAQLMTSLNLPNTAMAVITDVGDPVDIHPRKKEPVGARLALAARALAYNEKIVYSGPVYESMKVEGNKAILGFRHVGGGLTARGGKLTGFTICGPDHRFVNADAEIQGDKVIVTSPNVASPVAVRYGWANCPVVNLENKEGLPASPFRTDDFQMLTGPKKPATGKQ